MEKQTDAPILLCGRYFTLQELNEIRDTARMFPKLSRAELAKTLCENMDWVTPTGQYKTISCLQLLEKLEGQELITLPVKKEYKSRDKKGIGFGPHTDPAPLVEGFVADYDPIAVEPVWIKLKRFISTC
jgi:hypothetical protein